MNAVRLVLAVLFVLAVCPAARPAPAPLPKSDRRPPPGKPGYLGMLLCPDFGLPDAVKLGLSKVQGALVDAVYPETPAAAAGLRRNDVILELNGMAVQNENTLIYSIRRLRPGQVVRLRVLRGRKR